MAKCFPWFVILSFFLCVCVVMYDDEFDIMENKILIMEKFKPRHVLLFKILGIIASSVKALQIQGYLIILG